MSLNRNSILWAIFTGITTGAVGSFIGFSMAPPCTHEVQQPQVIAPQKDCDVVIEKKERADDNRQGFLINECELTHNVECEFRAVPKEQ